MSVAQALAIAAAALVMSFHPVDSALSDQASSAASHIMAKVRDAPVVKVIMNVADDARAQSQLRTCGLRGARL